MKGDSKVNWKRLANNTGLPIGVIRSATKGLSGRPRKLLLDALLLPSDGKDSRYYAHQHSYDHSFDSAQHASDISTEQASTTWDALVDNWNTNTWWTKRWRKERAQAPDPYREKGKITYYEDDQE